MSRIRHIIPGCLVFFIEVKHLNRTDKKLIRLNKLNIFELGYYSVHAAVRMRYEAHSRTHSLAIKHNSQTALIIYNAK